MVGKIYDPFYYNSIYIMLTEIAKGGLGFIFWIIAAVCYSRSDVGIATALISSVSLIILLSRLGIDQSLIRFVSENDENDIIFTAMVVPTLLSMVLGIIFLFNVGFWSPTLSMIKEHSYLYLLVLGIESITNIAGIAFIALRKAKYAFYQSLIYGSRFLFLLPMALFGSLGIFTSLGIAFICALFYSVFILYFKFNVMKISFNLSFLKKTVYYSFGNYISGLFLLSPPLILPIIVLNIVGPQMAAIFYMSFTIATFLFIVPNALGMALFVEGSYGLNLKGNATKAVLGSLLLLIPAIVFIVIFGQSLLNLVGNEYEAGFGLLVLMAISSIFVTGCQIYISTQKIKKELNTIVFLSGAVFILIISSSYYFLKIFGIDGVGYSWITSYGIVCLIILGLMRFKNRPRGL